MGMEIRWMKTAQSCENLALADTARGSVEKAPVSPTYCILDLC